MVLRESGNAHFLGRPLYHAGAGAGGVLLGHGGHGGAVDALVAFDRVLREETTSVELGEVQRQRADEGGEAALPVAVLASRPAAARPVGLRVHRGVRDLLSESANQCLHVDDVVVEPGHGEHIRRRV